MKKNLLKNNTSITIAMFIALLEPKKQQKSDNDILFNKSNSIDLYDFIY